MNALFGIQCADRCKVVLQFQLTVNFVALVIAFVSALTKGETPLTVIQLLWVNLIMDALGALGDCYSSPYFWCPAYHYDHAVTLAVCSSLHCTRWVNLQSVCSSSLLGYIFGLFKVGKANACSTCWHVAVMLATMWFSAVSPSLT